MGERGDRAKMIHGTEVENRLSANEWKRPGVGLATRQRRGRGRAARGERGQGGEAGPALAEGAEPRRLPGGSTAPESRAAERCGPGRGVAAVPAPPQGPSPPGPPRSSTAAGKASRNSSSRRGRSLMAWPVSVQCESAKGSRQLRR